MSETIVVRIVDDQLAWYPPGEGDSLRRLDDDAARAGLVQALENLRGSACLAVPGEALRLLELEIEEDERRHIQRSLPFMLEEQLAEDVDDLHFASLALDRLHYGVAVCARERRKVGARSTVAA